MGSAVLGVRSLWAVSVALGPRRSARALRAIHPPLLYFKGEETLLGLAALSAQADDTIPEIANEMG